MDFLPLCSCGEQFLHEHGQNFYVSVIDGRKTGLLAGPFTTHAEALRLLPDTKAIAQEVDYKSAFYAFGTVSMKIPYCKSGILNDFLFKIPEPIPEKKPRRKSKATKA